MLDPRRVSPPADTGDGRRVARRPVRVAPHCAVLVESRHLGQPQPAGMARALSAAGCRVTVCDVDTGLLDVENARWLEGIDLVVARGSGTALLTRLRAAELAGVPTLNPHRAIAAVHDKARMAVDLHAARVPTPRTWIGSLAQVRSRIPSTAFPVILKPVAGDGSHGMRIVETPAALQDVAWTEPCVIAQRLLPPGGFDVRLYAIGDRTWAARQRSPLLGGAEALTPVAMPPSWRALALKCGALFGLELFAVDCIETDGQLQVIEVSDFPDYVGVDGADLLLARHAALHLKTRRWS